MMWRLACGVSREAVLSADAVLTVWRNAPRRSVKNRGVSLRIVPALLSLLLIHLVAGCAGVAPLKPLAEGLKPAILADCRQPFLSGKYRLVHSVSAELPGGGRTTALGVLVADPRTRSFRSVLMTLEGMVLFDGETGAVPTVHRAVSPFDAPAFAGRMAEDIGLAFFAPAGAPVLWGEAEQGFRGCRYGSPDGGFVDVLKDAAGRREIRRYGAGQELRKRVKISALERPGLAEELEIRGESGPSYGLHLRLIEAETVE